MGKVIQFEYGRAKHAETFKPSPRKRDAIIAESEITVTLDRNEHREQIEMLRDAFSGKRTLRIESADGPILVQGSYWVAAYRTEGDFVTARLVSNNYTLRDTRRPPELLSPRPSTD